MCSHDCFHCPYEDCIWPDEDFELTALEIAQSAALDREAERSCCEGDYEDDERKAAEARRRQRRREWYLNHRGNELVKKAQYRQTHKAEKAKQDADYYQRHRDEINRRKRERRAIEKAAKAARKKQNQADR